MEIIAHIENDYKEKFGVPRQSGLADKVLSRVVFEEPYRVPEAFRGIEEYSHLWLIWGFSKNEGHAWSPTVRPPKLGGNVRLGVFATRSPFRPNPLGLSCVRIVKVDPAAPDGAVLTVAGADLMDKTPIYDIKPYLPYTDAVPEARGGFGQKKHDERLCVILPEALAKRFPAEKKEALCELLSLDPRPGYHTDPSRDYGISFSGYDIHFTVADGVLTVRDIKNRED